MDDRFTPRPVAGWFMLAAVASLLVMLLGCVALAIHLTTDPATLPLDQRAMFEAEPGWVLAASAVGFVAGAIGSLLLVMRRRIAQPVLAVSVAGFVAWFIGIMATPGFRDLLSSDRIAILLVVVALAWTIFWFARHSRQRGWLR